MPPVQALVLASELDSLSQPLRLRVAFICPCSCFKERALSSDPMARHSTLPLSSGASTLRAASGFFAEQSAAEDEAEGVEVDEEEVEREELVDAQPRSA